jgi:uncharacterized protein YggU (UPF0235/DUF167 family)
MPSWLAGTPGDWTLLVRAQPGAARSGVAGEYDGCLRIRIAAPPIDGRANDALRAFLADRLDVPRSAVRIEHGDASRRKRVSVAADCDAATLARRLAID